MRICLAASGGGHVRQLLDLAPIWSLHDAFFITERTALGESVAAEHRTHFVTHVAVGQARLGRPWLMLRSAWRNFHECARAILAERPDVVISTGAGAVFFALLWGRLVGAKIIAIESFARFDRPSLFMRLAAPFAHHKVVQSQKLSRWWPDAQVFDPLQPLDKPRPAKEPLLFATVGATLPFDRLVESVAELRRSGHIKERVIAQVGKGGVRPEGIESVESLTFAQMKSLLEKADIVVCHGGTGSLITSLREGCRTIAMPRLFELSEHYDDHQEEITSAFAARGLIKCARNLDELRSAICDVRTSQPTSATTDPQALMQWLQERLGEMEREVSARTL